MSPENPSPVGGVTMRNHGDLSIISDRIEEPFRFIHLGDPHLIDLTETEETLRSHAKNRFGDFFDPNHRFEKMSEKIRSENPNFVICSGDFIDFFSEKQIESACDMIRSLGCPFYFTPGNHDYQDIVEELDGSARVIDPVENPNLRREEKIKVFKKYCTHDLPHWRFQHKGVTFLGLDNSTYTVDSEGINLLRSVADEGGPFCVFHHIPVGLPGLLDRTILRWRKPICFHPGRSLEEFKAVIESADNFCGSFVGHQHFRSEDRFGGSYQFLVSGGLDLDYRVVDFIPQEESCLG